MEVLALFAWGLCGAGRAARNRGVGKGRRAHRQGPGPRGRHADPRQIPRHPVCGAARGQPALAPAPGARALARPARCDRVRQPLPAGSIAVRLRVRHRGLPVPERLHAEQARRKGQVEGTSRDGLAARRRADRRRERRLRPDATGGAGRDRRDGQLSPGLPRVPRPPRAERRVRRPGLRQLRADGPAGRAALGAAQHREVRRRRGQRDDLRPVRRRPQRALAPRVAALQRPVRPRDLAERRIHDGPAVARGRGVERHRRRAGLRLPGPVGGVPACGVRSTPS